MNFAWELGRELLVKLRVLVPLILIAWFVGARNEASVVVFDLPSLASVRSGETFGSWVAGRWSWLVLFCMVLTIETLIRLNLSKKPAPPAGPGKS